MKKYLIALGAGLGLTAWIVYAKDIYAQTELVKIFHILCDGFFVSGVVLTCGGAMVFTTNEGTFDMIVYGVSSFFDLFRKTSKKKYDTFYDYRVAREGKKLRFAFLLLAGLTLLIISAVCYVLYLKFS